MNSRELVENVHHIALATVSDNGTPHNTPLFFMYSSDFTKLYFGSHKDSLHVRNITRSGLGYAVVYESAAYKYGGLYLTLQNGHEVTREEMSAAMTAHNEARARRDKEPLAQDHYPTSSGQNMYVADIVSIEKYSATKDVDGHIYQESRVHISKEEIING